MAAKTPSETHLHVRRYQVSDIPMDSEEAAAGWLKARFAEKEARLRAFYNTGSFPDSKYRPVSVVKSLAALLFLQALFFASVVAFVKFPLYMVVVLVVYLAVFRYFKVCRGCAGGCVQCTGCITVVLVLEMRRHGVGATALPAVQKAYNGLEMFKLAKGL